MQNDDSAAAPAPGAAAAPATHPAADPAAREGSWRPADDEAYAALVARDSRFDGWIVAGVLSTGIYCRPSCPAPVRPKRHNVRFFATPAAAHAAGLRACKRCRPDAVPGSPAWAARGDLVARAMRLIADGTVDREGVEGVAARLHVSARHLRRCVRDELGAGPRAIARAHRAQTARVLIESSDLAFGDVAHAAGFGSLRQFNDTVREVFATTPTQLRRGARGRAGAAPHGPTRTATDVTGPPGDADRVAPPLRVELAFRPPLHAAALWDWFAAQAVPGLEDVTPGHYARVLSLPSGPGVARVERPAAGADRLVVELHLAHVRDLPAAVERCRRMLDLDADPATIAAALATDPGLAPLARLRPGIRVPGAVDAVEGVTRTILAQQVSVAAARTHTARLVATAGRPLPAGLAGVSGLTHAFPTAAQILATDGLRLPASRRATLRTVVAALDEGAIDLGPGADRHGAAEALLGVRGIGPWTVDCVRLLTLRDPDAFPSGDLVLRRRAAAVGLPGEAGRLRAHARRWTPWGGYAAMHLWAAELADRAAAQETTAPEHVGAGGPTPAVLAGPDDRRAATTGTRP